jgi:hypothetical protein
MSVKSKIEKIIRWNDNIMSAATYIDIITKLQRDGYEINEVAKEPENAEYIGEFGYYEKTLLYVKSEKIYVVND